jgi:hypothetical protein
MTIIIITEQLTLLNTMQNGLNKKPSNNNSISSLVGSQLWQAKVSISQIKIET